jgi:hypothetical protein
VHAVFVIDRKGSTRLCFWMTDLSEKKSFEDTGIYFLLLGKSSKISICCCFKLTLVTSLLSAACRSMNEVLFLKSDVIPHRIMKPIKKGCICNDIPKLK